MDILKIVLAILLPPIAVLLHKGIGMQLLLNILLCLLGLLPGMVHAVWVIAKT
ncbi:MAG: YqaE/Pmp3 family membrane protein [Planctomycetota bacterium]